MKRYKVWARCGHSSTCGSGEDTILEFPNSTSEKEIQAACADALDVLIGNSFDTGWDPIEEEKPLKVRPGIRPAGKGVLR